MDQHRGGGLALGHVSARQAAEEGVADEPPDDRKARLERADQGRRDIVAIDLEAPRVGHALASARVNAGVASGEARLASKAETVSSKRMGDLPALDRLRRPVGAPRLGVQRLPFRHVVIPLDQRRQPARARDHAAVEIEHTRPHRQIVGVDQQPMAGVVLALEIAGEMDFADRSSGNASR